jgi:transposase InsO family protein
VRTGEHGMSVKKACGRWASAGAERPQTGGGNVLNRELSVQKRNSVWRGDIACIPTREGRLYLATRLDLFSCKIVGWHVLPAAMRTW